MLRDIKYTSPETLADAAALLGKHGDDATIISGGQSLMPMLRQRLTNYELLVDINEVQDQDYIQVDGDELRIGCLVRHNDVANSETVADHCEMLAETAAEIGDTQVRNRGTICGAVAHADPAGDPPVVATALDAEIKSCGPDGEHAYDASSFFHGFYETELGKDEIVTEVVFPVVEPPLGAAYQKYEPSAGAYPTATVAAVVELDGDEVAAATLVTGAIEPGPTPMPDAEAQLEGETLTEAVVTEVAELVGDESEPMEDSDGSVEFKREITKTLAKRALVTAIDRAGGDIE
ncbi:FAD binding domain-containing protein [Natrinema gelatinilyticum]|uniref:FAD binding domain-containing protein n=1 Tax=Natrinema gelatinilyticum TaxID=2961571 RepID=UPI0020C20DDF|nr:xanthine dehydrogenase family protein subunit M [Natrinema gelatinilyticum]